MCGHAVVGTGANQHIWFQYYPVTGFYEGEDSTEKVEPGSNGCQHLITIVGNAFNERDFRLIQSYFFLPVGIVLPEAKNQDSLSFFKI
jgi:hypothetical protein